MFKLRLAIFSLFLCVLFSALAPGLADVGIGALLTHSGLFSLVLTGAFVFTLAYPVTENSNWLKMAMLSAITYLILVIGFRYVQSAPIPDPGLIFVQTLILLVIVPLSCWVSSCLAGFENSVYQLGLNSRISDIRDPESEESVQYMLMNSRYTGQSLGFISIDVCQQAREKFQSRLLEQLLQKAAEEHWQTELSRELRKELRIIDRFYKQGSDNRLLLMCPGLNDSELADLSLQLENVISNNASSTSTCHHVSFPDEALTFEALLKRLDDKSNGKPGTGIQQSVYGIGNAIASAPKKLATRTLVEESD